MGSIAAKEFQRLSLLAFQDKKNNAEKWLLLGMHHPPTLNFKPVLAKTGKREKEKRLTISSVVKLPGGGQAFIVYPIFGSGYKP